MAAQTSSVEFLPQEDWEKSSWGKFLKWSLSIGRYIVVFTELIVVLALLSRFKLDRDLAELNEQIKQQQAILTASAQFEEEFRELQDKLEQADRLTVNQDKPTQLVQELGALVPVNVVLSNLSFNNEKLSLSAEALDQNGLATLINALRDSEKFADVAVVKINSEEKEKATIDFDLSLTYKD